METQARLLDHAAAMPAPTWHFLKMNDTSIEIPAGLKIAPCVTVSKACRVSDSDEEFERAMADAQKTWEAECLPQLREKLAEQEALLAAESDATYGGTAQSDYQKRADALEAAQSLSFAFEHGLGSEAADLLRSAAGPRIVVQAEPGQDVVAEVIVDTAHGTMSAAAVDVVAAAESSVRLSVLVDSQDDAAGESDAIGLAATSIRVFAGENAHVDIVRTQTLGNGFTDLDDMGLFAQTGARVQVRQTVLGADASFTGLAGDLRGNESTAEVETHYLGLGSQRRDFNYSLRHHGIRTKCELTANGVLAGTSSKVLRGTIDFVRGCKESEGSERENVLLIDDGVRNKTVPVILCNEDDVAGNHGATIGHIGDDQLFYLASRGLSQEAAEDMFTSAVIEQAALSTESPAIRKAVIRYGERISPDFPELFDEEAMR